MMDNNKREYEAIIFDMDGVLINSEPLWRAAEIKSFALVGLKLTDHNCQQTAGLRVREVVDFWFNNHPWSLHDFSKEKMAQTIKENVISLINASEQEESLIMEGATDLIISLYQQGLPLALCSSSPLIIIKAVITKMEIAKYLSVVVSGEDFPLGKPHPACYLACAEKLNVNSTCCLVVEDSFNGMIAAKAARMKVIAMPASDQIIPHIYDQKIARLCDMNKIVFSR